jgi:hypothetical protein
MVDEGRGCSNRPQKKLKVIFRPEHDLGPAIITNERDPVIRAHEDVQTYSGFDIIQRKHKTIEEMGNSNPSRKHHSSPHFLQEAKILVIRHNEFLIIRSPCGTSSAFSSCQQSRAITITQMMPR